jgi:chorismate synthase
MGSPLALLVRNLDHASWLDVMDPFEQPQAAAPVDAADGDHVTTAAEIVPSKRSRILSRPRPGHADLAGALKLGTKDARDVLERASARSTAARVAAGAVCKRLLEALGVRVVGHVVSIGSVTAPATVSSLSMDALVAATEASEVRCADPSTSEAMKATIDEARRQGDSLGGVVEVLVEGAPVGLGSHADWELRLEGKLAQAVMSVQAIKGVEIGLGFRTAALRGSQVHDPIEYRDGRFHRPTNHAGGIEGGITNGERIVVRAAMKPIPTLARALASVDLVTKQPFDAAKERTDSVAVPACAVVVEAAVAFVLADAALDKLGGDSMDEVLASLRALQARLAAY